MPEFPIEIKYEKNEQLKTYNILVSSNMGSSPKKVVDEIGVDLSKIRWPDTLIPRFNVTHITELDNEQIIA